MTGEVESGSPAHAYRLPAGALAALFGIMAIYVTIDTEWLVLDTVLQAGALSAGAAAQVRDVFSNTIPWIAQMLLRDFVLAFEAASVVLLAAIIGALALIRQR